ncbi:DUF6318 family protein [Pedococcus sp. P5_B7]
MSSKHGYAAALSLLVACGVGALTGCTGGADDPPATGTGTAVTGGTPTALPSSSPPITTTTSTITTSAAVQIPAAARAHTKAGAEAFVRFYMEQANRTWVEPNATLLPALSDSGCLSCKEIQKTAAELVRDGQHYVSDPVTVTRVAAFGGAPTGQQYVRLFMIQHKVEVVDSTGRVVLTDPKKSLARTAGVIWEETSWRMYDIG